MSHSLGPLPASLDGGGWRIAVRRLGFRESPHVVILASSFSPRGSTPYARLGDRYVGTLRDCIVRGQDEHPLWKSLAPWSDLGPPSGDAVPSPGRDGTGNA